MSGREGKTRVQWVKNGGEVRKSRQSPTPSNPFPEQTRTTGRLDTFSGQNQVDSDTLEMHGFTHWGQDTEMTHTEVPGRTH